MKRKYGSELWFQGKSHNECISVKDALKISIVKPLETILVSELIVLGSCYMVERMSLNHRL